jgi:iron complex outermembrane receptor protein
MAKLLFGAQTGIVLAMTVLGAQVSHAQQQTEADPDTVFQIAPVSVTVLRSPLQMTEVPYAISVNTEREIQLGKPGLSVEEALRVIPGVQVENRHNYALGERISIRGFGARAQFGVRGVRVLVDGVPATLPDGQSSLTYVDVHSLGRVEVVRGPAASLYGNTAGGVIQMEMQQPPPYPISQEFGVTGGSDGLLRLRSSTSGQSNRTNYQLNLTRLSTDGYRAHSSSEVMYLNGRVGYDGDRDRFRLVFSGGDTDALNPGSLSAAQQEVDRFQAFQNNVNARTGKTIREGLLGGSWFRDLSSGALEVSSYVSKRDVVNPIPADIIDLGRVATGVRGLYRTNRIGSYGLQVAIGAEADRQRDDRREYDNEGGNKGALSLDQLETVNNVGLFGQATMHLTPELSVLAALRYDWFGFKADDNFIAEDNPDDSGSRNLDAISPSFGITYAFSEDFHLYGNVGKTFETPTTVELGNRPDSPGGLNPDLDPQEALSYEIGGRAVIADRVALQLAAYQSDVTNSLIPYQVPNSPGRDYFQNAGSATHRGFEFGATIVPVSGISIQTAYTYTDAKFDEYVDRAGNDHSGNAVPGVAPHRFETVLNLAPRDFPAYLAIENKNLSEVAVNDANTAHSPSYNITDVRAGLNELRLGSVTLEPYFGVTNVFDAEYNTSLAVNAFGQRFFESGPGRSFYVGGHVRLDRR